MIAIRPEKDTRERIIAAAYSVLAEKGYDAASTKEIARGAGVAQGLINYYFSSKDDLFIEVVREEGRRFCQAMEELHNQKHADGLYQKAFENIKGKLSGNPQWYRLRYELYALGLRNDKIIGEVNLQVTESRQRIGQLFSNLSGKPASQLESVAAIVLASLEGLALQKLIDPGFEFDQAFGILYDMVMLYLNNGKGGASSANHL